MKRIFAKVNEIHLPFILIIIFIMGSGAISIGERNDLNKKKSDFNSGDLIEFSTNILKASNNEELAGMNILGERVWFANFENQNLSESFRLHNENSPRPEMVSTIITQEKSLSGSKSIKMTSNTSNGIAGTRNYSIDQEKDMIYVAHYLFPQKLDFLPRGSGSGNRGSNILQTKQATTPIGTGSQIGFSLNWQIRGDWGSGGNNFLQFIWHGWRWNTSNVVYNSHIPDKTNAPQGLDIPVNQWFRVKWRIIQNTIENGIPKKNGRIIVWQNNDFRNGFPDSSDKLLADYDGLVIVFAENETFNPVKKYLFPDGSTKLSITINNYSQNTVPAITSIYADDLGIYFPGSVGEQTINSHNIQLKAYPNNSGTVKIKND